MKINTLSSFCILYLLLVCDCESIHICDKQFTTFGCIKA